MVEVEAVGEALGGAMAGRAVEPVPDGMGGEKLPGPGDCLNCATPLEGRNYCHHCGQKAKVHRTLRGLASDFIHGVLHFDGKFWRTLPMLFVAPGDLTRRYVAGQRARFISPIAVYLFAVVAMFAFVISVGEIDPGDVTVGDAIQADTVEEQEAIVSELEADIAELQEEDFPGSQAVERAANTQLAEARRRLSELKNENAEAVPEADTLADGVAEELGVERGNAEALSDLFTEVQENPSLYLYKVQTKAYKLSWLLIPLSLPFMFLLFPFSRRFKMYDHAVFVTYSISFMMLLVLALAALAAIFSPGSWMAWALLVPPIHMYRQLRGAYDLGRGGALVRTFLLLIFSFVTLAMFIALMLALGIM